MAKGHASSVRLFLRRDGRLKWMTVQCIVLKDDQEQSLGFFIYMYDSTTERELRPKSIT